MGTMCCRPLPNTQPKHLLLLQLTYQEAAAFSPDLSANNIGEKTISDSLCELVNRKGYIKTLIDYLSSHVHSIGSSIDYCKVIQGSAHKNPLAQLKYAIVGVQICSKIVVLATELKAKSQNLRLSEEQEKEIKRSLYFSGVEVKNSKTENKKEPNRHNVLHRKSAEFSQTELRSYHSNDRNFEKEKRREHGSVSKVRKTTKSFGVEKIAEDLEYNLYSLSLQIFRNCRREEWSLEIEKYGLQGTKEQILVKLLGMLKTISQNYSFSKIDPNMIKKLLDQLLECLTPEKSERKNKNSFIHQQRRFKINQISLLNYKQILSRDHSSLAKTNGYKELVRDHMHHLLQYWATQLLVQRSKEPDYDSTKQVHSTRNLQTLSNESQQDENSIPFGKGGQKRYMRSSRKNESHIEEIILQFFNSYFCKESEFIYKELLMIFDQLRFRREKIQAIQQLFFRALQGYELRDHVMYKWFEYILDYLAVLGISAGNNPSNSRPSKQLNYILQNSQSHDIEDASNYLREIDLPCNFLYLKSKQINNMEENIIGCIKTIRKWICSEQVRLSNILQYKAQKLYIAVLVNLCRGSKTVKHEIISLFQELIYMDTKVYVGIVENSVSLISALKVDTDGLIKRIWRAYQEKPNHSSFPSNITPNSLPLFPKNMIIFFQSSHLISSLLTGGHKSEAKDNVKFQRKGEKVWEQYESERSKSPLGERKSSKSIGDGRKPKPLKGIISNKTQVMSCLEEKTNEILPEINQGSKSSQQIIFKSKTESSIDKIQNGIISVEQFIEEVIDVAAYGYFQNYNNYRKWRTSHKPVQQYLRIRRQLIKQNAENKKKEEDQRERTSMMKASQCGIQTLKRIQEKTEKVKLLGRQSGVNPEQKNVMRSTEYGFSISSEDLHEIISIILKQGKLIDTYRTNTFYLVHLAAKIIQNSGILTSSSLRKDSRISSNQDSLNQQIDSLVIIGRTLAKFQNQCLRGWERGGNGFHYSKQNQSENYEQKLKQQIREENRVSSLLIMDAMHRAFLPAVLKLLPNKQKQKQSQEQTISTPSINSSPKNHQNREVGQSEDRETCVGILVKILLKNLLMNLTVNETPLFKNFSHERATSVYNLYLVTHLIYFLFQIRELWRENVQGTGQQNMAEMKLLGSSHNQKGYSQQYDQFFVEAGECLWLLEDSFSIWEKEGKQVDKGPGQMKLWGQIFEKYYDYGAKDSKPEYKQSRLNFLIKKILSDDSKKKIIQMCTFFILNSSRPRPNLKSITQRIDKAIFNQQFGNMNSSLLPPGQAKGKISKFFSTLCNGQQVAPEYEHVNELVMESIKHRRGNSSQEMVSYAIESFSQCFKRNKDLGFRLERSPQRNIIEKIMSPREEYYEDHSILQSLQSRGAEESVKNSSVFLGSQPSFREAFEAVNRH